MRSEPLVTVNILSFNRKEELRITLTKVFEQDYKNIEVIVVDNASEDGTQQMVQSKFPAVKLLQLKKNIGIAGWNKGFEAAKGEYVLVLDDDSYPEKNTIRAGMNKIFSSENIAIIAFNVKNLMLNKSQTKNFTSADYIEFIGCGAIILKSVFYELGGFDDDIFIYAHERDFAIRVLNQGFKIIYLNDFKVYHMPLMRDRKHPLFNETRIYHSTVSYLVILKKYLKSYNLFYFYMVVSKLLLNRFLILLYFNRIGLFGNILKYIFSEYKNIKNYSEPISYKVLKRFKYLNVAIFDEQYFPRVKNNSKFQILIYYLRTLFISPEKKILNINY